MLLTGVYASGIKMRLFEYIHESEMNLLVLDGFHLSRSGSPI